MGARFPKFQNPADFLLKMAQKPEIVNKELTKDTLVDTYNLKLRPQV